MRRVVARPDQSSQCPLALLIMDQRRTKPKSQGALHFAITLLQTFGVRYADHITRSLGKLSPVFDSVYRCFYEIQQQVASGGAAYVSHKFPHTRALLDQFTSLTCSETQVFALLKRRSYEMLPFHQRMLTYGICEREHFDAIYTDRKHAFDLLMDALRLQQEEEKKGVEVEECNARDELALTSLYFNGGALMYEGRIVYFSELIDIWAGFTEAASLRKEAFLQTLSAKKFVPQVKQPIASFTKYNRVESFREFLILCSIDAIQKNLNFQFPELLVNILKKLFLNEEIRSDLCYFTANLQLLYGLDLSQFNRRSVRYLEIFQLFLFIVRTQGVRGHYWGSLLVMLFNRSQWTASKTEGFNARAWGAVSVENEEFSYAFLGVQRLASAMTGRQVDLAHPTEEDGAFLEDCCTSDTLYFLWKNPRRVVFVENLARLAADPRFNLGFSSIHEFCVTNATCIRPELCAHFVDCYFGILQKFEDAGHQVTEAQHLFMVPSMGAEVASNHALRFGNGPTQAAVFIAAMQRYERPVDRDYFKMLREWVLRPKPFLLELLSYAQNIGVQKLNRKFFSSVMKQEHRPLGGNLTQEVNEQAVQLTSKIQDTYHFSDVQIFYLYIEVVRLILNDRAFVISRTAQLINKLTSFCPSFHIQDAYFLFQYHPDVAPEVVEAWVKLRIHWAKNDAMLARFVLPQDHIDFVLQQAGEFCESLSSSCPREEFRGTFDARCTQALFSAFYPPVQPLTDHFRLRSLSPEAVVEWDNVAMSTHEGQLKQIANTATGIYFHWDVSQGRPVFFFSFFNMQEKKAFSACIPLQVPLIQLDSQEKIDAFWGFMHRLSRQVLREEPDKSLATEAEETLESCAACFKGAPLVVQQAETAVKEGHLSIEQISSVWEFFRTLKITYRSLYLSCVAERALPPIPSYDTRQIAGLGHIFSSHPRGALLPKAVFEIDPHPEHFSPDASTEFVAGCRVLFSEPTQEFQRLRLSLQVPGGALAISYFVETVAKRKGVEEQEVKEMFEKEELPEFRSRYVTLCQPNLKIKLMLKYPFQVLDDPEAFQTYFDFHNLMLKAQAFRELFPN